MGLEELLSEIQNDTQSEYNSAVEQAEKQLEERLKQKKRELQKSSNRETSLRRREIEAEMKRKIKISEVDWKRQLQREKRNLTDRFLNDVWMNVFRQIKSDSGFYLKYLNKMLQKASELLDTVQIEIQLNAEDQVLFDQLKNSSGLELKLSEQSAPVYGGFLAKHERAVLDYSFNEIKESLKLETAVLVNRMLEE